MTCHVWLPNIALVSSDDHGTAGTSVRHKANLRMRSRFATAGRKNWGLTNDLSRTDRPAALPLRRK
jgi:hypothetical protein